MILKDECLCLGDNRPLPGDSSKFIEQPIRQTNAPPTAEMLSDRQRQVLEGLVGGLSHKEIARQHSISEGTVKMHIASLFRILGATNRTHAVSLGKQLIG